MIKVVVIQVKKKLLNSSSRVVLQIECNQNIFNFRISKPKSKIDKPQATILPFKFPIVTPQVDEEEFMKNLRGLNESFKSALLKEMESNPFAELFPLFEKYKSHFETFQLKSRNKEPVKITPFISVEIPKAEEINTRELKESSNVEKKSEEISKDQPLIKFEPASGEEEKKCGEKVVEEYSTTSITSNIIAEQPFKFEAPKFTFNFAAEKKCEEKIEESKKEKKDEESPFINSNPITSTTSNAISEQPIKFEAPKFTFNFAGSVPENKDLFKTFTFPSTETPLSVEKKEEDEDGIPEGEEESFKTTRSESELLKSGAGEEGEETLVETRCKLYQFDKEKGWKDLGIGFIKVNKRETKKRILCRAEGSGKILLNAAITKDVQVNKTSTTQITVICVNQEAKLAKYLIRVKEESTTDKLISEIK